MELISEVSTLAAKTHRHQVSSLRQSKRTGNSTNDGSLLTDTRIQQESQDVCAALEKCMASLEPIQSLSKSIQISTAELETLGQGLTLSIHQKLVETVKTFCRSQSELLAAFHEMVTPAISAFLESQKNAHATLQSFVNSNAQSRSPSGQKPEVSVSVDCLSEAAIQAQIRTIISAASTLESQADYLTRAKSYINHVEDVYIGYLSELTEQPGLQLKATSSATQKAMTWDYRMRSRPQDILLTSRLQSSIRSIVGLSQSTRSQLATQPSQQNSTEKPDSQALKSPAIGRTANLQQTQAAIPMDFSSPRSRGNTIDNQPLSPIRPIFSSASPSSLSSTSGQGSQSRLTSAMMETDIMMSHPRQKYREPVNSPPKQSPPDVPLVITRSIEYLSTKALRVEGIFRESGSKTEITAIHSAFQKGRDYDLSSTLDPHVVAGLFKTSLRDMSPPLFPYNMYHSFMDVDDLPTTEEKIVQYRTLISQLPSQNMPCIRRVMKFLRLVSQNSEFNKMSANNIGIVFGPTLLRPSANAVTISSSPSVIADLLTHYDTLFGL